MKPTIIPMPETTRPVAQPTPLVQPRRRTIRQPVFATTAPKAVTTMVLLMCLCFAQAQTRPVPDPPTKPGVPTNPMNPDEPRVPRTPPEQPAKPQPQTTTGWIMFDDRSAQDLGLEDDELQRLRDVDAKYHKEYTALGNEPVKRPGYQSVSERRNADVKRILTPEQYARWEKMQNGNRCNTTAPERTPGSALGQKPTP